MRRAGADKAGFTLVELLIVVLFIGILGAVAAPTYWDSTIQSQEETLRHNLAVMREAVEYYYHQHGGAYPGCVSFVDGKTPADNALVQAASFIYQLAYPSDAGGKVDPSTQARGSGYEYGPYIKGWKLPSNPLPDKDAKALLSPALTLVEKHGAALAADGENAQSGWKFNCQTGQFIANSDDLSTDGRT
ncbi:MAG: type II secretion system GspH family protein, partial [Candidatus Methylomirabilis sp.]|nr:type II secretion system GspH family protein [Deltaproteobacteria bacterium]